MRDRRNEDRGALKSHVVPKNRELDGTIDNRDVCKLGLDFIWTLSGKAVRTLRRIKVFADFICIESEVRLSSVRRRETINSKAEKTERRSPRKRRNKMCVRARRMINSKVESREGRSKMCVRRK